MSSSLAGASTVFARSAAGLTTSRTANHAKVRSTTSPSAACRRSLSTAALHPARGGVARPGATPPPRRPVLPAAPPAQSLRRRIAVSPNMTNRTMATVKAVSTSADADVERAGPFGPLSPAASLTLAVLATAGSSYLGMPDLPSVLAWGTVAAAALAQLNSAAGSPEVPILAGASLALVTLGYGPAEWAAAVVFGAAMCSRLPHIPVYIGWLTLALAAWQGYTFLWFVSAFAWYFAPGVVSGVQDKRVPVLPTLCIIVSLLTLVHSGINTHYLAWADPVLWTTYIVMGAVISHLIRAVLSLTDKA